MNIKKAFLLIISFSLLAQPLLLAAQEQSTATKIIKEAAYTAYDVASTVACTAASIANWGLKKVFDHDLYSILLTTPASQAHIITTDLGDKVLVDSYPPGRDIYGTTTINPYQNVSSIVSSKIFHGVCIAAVLATYGSRCYHQKEIRDQILRQASNWENAKKTPARNNASNRAYALADKCYNIYIPFLRNKNISTALDKFFYGDICYDQLKPYVDPNFFGQ